MGKNNRRVTVVNHYNVNDNVNGFETNNYIDNENDKYGRAKKVEYIADRLVEKFGNAQFRGFYCKVAWKLSEAKIWQNYEAAVKGNPTEPGRLFSYLCKRDGV